MYTKLVETRLLQLSCCYATLDYFTSQCLVATLLWTRRPLLFRCTTPGNVPLRRWRHRARRTPHRDDDLGFRIAPQLSRICNINIIIMFVHIYHICKNRLWVESFINVMFNNIQRKAIITQQICKINFVLNSKNLYINCY